MRAGRIAVRFCRALTSLLLALILMPRAASSQKIGGAAKTSATTAAVERPSPFRITGTVINSLTKSPVVRAEITVSPMGTRRATGRFAARAAGQTETAVADAQGRFVVEVPSAGGWSLSASAHGYHSQAYDEHGAYSTAIILTEASPSHDLTFPLTPAGAIEGYVMDEAGEAVRNAQLTVSVIPVATPENEHPKPQQRGSQRTDDRGYYKFFGLLAGSYEVRVQASPWYATNGAGGRIGNGVFGDGIAGAGVGSGFSSIGAIGSGNGSESSAPDPLDVVYPVMWYPSVTDYAAATPIPLRGGETREADFRLLPVSGFHLRISEKPAPEESTATSDRRLIRNNVYLSQILPDGTDAALPVPSRMEANGTMEFSGLAPGTYVVHQRGEGGWPAGTATVRIAENSARTVDASQETPGVTVTVKIDADADKPSLQISFRDIETGQVSFVQGMQALGSRGGRRVRGGADAAQAKDGEVPGRTISLAPGSYDVLLSGIGEMHLASIEAKGATATGRRVTIAGGSPVLTLHVANGRANVTGFVQSAGRPVEGAMVLLVPATLGDPAGLNATRLDQSNTDGSFDIAGVLPGAYILVAIDHGWAVNWSDPARLSRFLMNGMPLDLTTPKDRKETVEALSP